MYTVGSFQQQFSLEEIESLWNFVSQESWHLRFVPFLAKCVVDCGITALNSDVGSKNAVEKGMLLQKHQGAAEAYDTLANLPQMLKEVKDQVEAANKRHKTE